MIPDVMKRIFIINANEEIVIVSRIDFFAVFATKELKTSQRASRNNEEAKKQIHF